VTDQAVPDPADLEPEDLLPGEAPGEADNFLTPEEAAANRHAEEGRLRDTFFGPNAFRADPGPAHPEDDEHPTNLPLMPGGLT
jgi:hypothetical protein